MEGKVEIKDLAPQRVLTMRFHSNVEKIGTDIGTAFAAFFHYLAELGENPAGMPFTLYHLDVEGEFDPREFDSQNIDMEVVVPTAGLLESNGEIEARELPGGMVAFVMHKGPYKDIEPAYEAIADFVKKNGYRYSGPPREIYFNDPNEVPQSELLTEIQFPISK
ncbi:MAG: GyrI-like domain-containing protein [Actinomycetota bacterium]|nr:GyrI-like domain-containing protein [Actinomycetota bacterium]